MGCCAQNTSISIFSVRNQTDEIILHYVAYQTLKDSFKTYISKYRILFESLSRNLISFGFKDSERVATQSTTTKKRKLIC
jgi:hypothetical protein